MLSPNWVRTLLDRILLVGKSKAQEVSQTSCGVYLVRVNKHIGSSIKAAVDPCSFNIHISNRALDFFFSQAHRFLFYRHQIYRCHFLNNMIQTALRGPSCLFPGRAKGGREGGRSQKHDHMFKPCPMNPKQDVAAGPPVRLTDTGAGTQEGYCFALI